MTKRQALDPQKGAGFYDMPKQPELEPEREDPVKSRGVGLKTSEWARFDAIAAELGETRHAVAMFALKDFLRRWDAGEIQTKSKPSLPKI